MQEEKQLLLKDLCSRLPYRVKVHIIDVNGAEIDDELTTSTISHLDRWVVKPYLRPMSSMTEEEFFEYRRIKFSKVTYREEYKRIDVGKYHNVGIIPIDEYLDWLNAHHFDYRGLIRMGLALEAPEDMYKEERI